MSGSGLWLFAGGVSPASVDIAVLVFREGLESVLVLAAITASMVGSSREYRRPIAMGVVAGIAATLVTWAIAVGVINSLSDNISALHLQVITGLIAIVVLLVVMNWFFHRLYWSGWISLHTRRKREILKQAGDARSRTQVLWGLVFLGFTSFYREGFEVVLFLQSYRLKLGNEVILQSVVIGVILTCVVAMLTFVANQRLSRNPLAWRLCWEWGYKVSIWCRITSVSSCARPGAQLVDDRHRERISTGPNPRNVAASRSFLPCFALPTTANLISSVGLTSEPQFIDAERAVSLRNRRGSVGFHAHHRANAVNGFRNHD